ncbi:hypothetical protein [Sphingobium yanoikuyae]|uniref:hypothetical protein n=1 Tax=Sphingobium yanoikuyae TaxID=13690 RepID=UPI0039959205
MGFSADRNGQADFPAFVEARIGFGSVSALSRKITGQREAGFGLAVLGRNVKRANPRRLAHLAAEYGIERKGMHVAGNDALITLQVAFAMAATEPGSSP